MFKDLYDSNYLDKESYVKYFEKKRPKDCPPCCFCNTFDKCRDQSLQCLAFEDFVTYGKYSSESIGKHLFQIPIETDDEEEKRMINDNKNLSMQDSIARLIEIFRNKENNKGKTTKDNKKTNLYNEKKQNDNLIKTNFTYYNSDITDDVQKNLSTNNVNTDPLLILKQKKYNRKNELPRLF